MMNRTFISVLLVAAGFLSRPASAQTVIRLTEDKEGKYTMDATVNGVGVKTYYTPESWYASMSSNTYLFLYENGYIVPADVNGMTTVMMPGGSSTKAGSFVIRNLRIGNVIVKDLPAFVIAKQVVPLLVGSSAFDCFGTVSIEDGKLIIDDRFEEDLALADGPEADSPEQTDDPTEKFKAAQQHMEAGEYAEAAECFAALQDMGLLTMYSEYQYAMVLNILHRNDDCIALSERWMAENKGKSSTLDYWMNDALGDSYARKGNRNVAIRYYEEAVAAYCKIFNTTEKEIKKSKFKDETLGYTLYNLAMQYASSNIGKTWYYCELAAKSGNAAAIEFLEKTKKSR